MARDELSPSYRRSSGLVDVLDRVLDKGLVVAGDIRVSLAEVELLTIRIRLLVCSVDKAEQIGIDWWKNDPHLAGGAGRLQEENATLRERIRLLEDRITAMEPARPAATKVRGAKSARGSGTGERAGARSKRKGASNGG